MARSLRTAEYIGSLIAQQRLKAGLTQEQVAEYLDIGNEAISRIERGVVIPNILRMLEFADIFNCSINDLVGTASYSVVDQNIQLHQLLLKLSPKNRLFLLEIVEKIAEKLINEKC